MLELGTKILVSYLLGALLGSLIVGRLRGGVDIRTLGSGNAGGTNALRTQGLGFAAWVMVIDVGKGFIASAIIPAVPISWLAPSERFSGDWLTVACATAVVIGHVYPVWYGFRGGKGAATLIGVLLGIHPLAVGPILLVWLAVVMVSGFVGLATILATASFPAYLYISSAAPTAPIVTFAFVMVPFVCFTHRANLARMLSGTENRAKRLWILGPK